MSWKKRKKKMEKENKIPDDVLRYIDFRTNAIYKNLADRIYKLELKLELEDESK